MTEYDTKQYNINNCSTIFKLPIDYLNNKSILEKNIHSDLELTELKDNSNNCLYDNVFEPKNTFSKITTKLWSEHFTTDVDFLKDLLDVIEREVDALGERSGGDSGSGSNKLIGASYGVNADNQFNIIPDFDGKVFFLRQASNSISIKLTKGSQAQLTIRDSDLGDSIICLSSCENIIITITQE